MCVDNSLNAGMISTKIVAIERGIKKEHGKRCISRINITL